MELLIWSLQSFHFNAEDNLYIVSLKAHNIKGTLE